jgi:hypothetical protein
MGVQPNGVPFVENPAHNWLGVVGHMTTDEKKSRQRLLVRENVQ